MSSSKHTQINCPLTLSTESILFSGNFYQTVTTTILDLTNETSNSIIFKIKTTAPKRYCVRPNSGKLNPGALMPVKILLQPSEDLKNLDFTKHKFLLQTMIIDDKNYPDLFKKEILNEKSPDEIFKDKLLNKFSTSKKLFCRFNNLGGDDKVRFPPSYQETVQIRQNNQKLTSNQNNYNLTDSNGKESLLQAVLEETSPPNSPIAIQNEENEENEEVEVEPETQETATELVNISHLEVKVETPPVEASPKSTENSLRQRKPAAKTYTTISREELAHLKSTISQLKETLLNPVVLPVFEEEEPKPLENNQNKPNLVEFTVENFNDDTESEKTTQAKIVWQALVIIALLAFVFGYLVSKISCGTSCYGKGEN